MISRSDDIFVLGISAQLKFQQTVALLHYE